MAKLKLNQDRMHEKVTLEVMPGIPLSDEPEETDVEISKLRTFSGPHQDEVFKIIVDLPSTSASDSKFEFAYQRFVTLLDLYQDQPLLLDCCIGEMISNLLCYVQFLDEKQTKFTGLSSSAFKLLSHLSKVRGYKSFLAFLPHEVIYLEKVLSSLERLSDDFHASYVLLLWMVILCKNPFNLNLFAPNQNDPLYTDRRVITVALSYLSRPVDKCHPVAALLLAITACRAEACSVLLPSLVQTSTKILKECEEKSSNNINLVGHLYLLVAVFKQGRRKDLLTLAPLVLNALSFVREIEQADFVVKKLVTKLVQRLGMVFLKPKIAAWRYDRGNRVLSFAQNVDDLLQDKMAEELGDNSDYDIPHTELEFVMDIILKSLRDCDTGIRWSAAKGVGRVASRLPKTLAEDVVRSILAYNFDDTSGHAAWHGGCLAIAELARRGYLTISLLPEVSRVLSKALTYEEPQGRHALGANVRDAACYIAWALARAFRPSDMVQFMEEIATSLICVALFDREINVRRAASAAFQENVGRQGTFPNGIDILTKIDFFAVGQRTHTYIKIACEIAKYPRYTWPIVRHLLFKKVTHWDENLRLLAAESVRRLAQVHGALIVNQIPVAILPLLTHKLPAQRQGGILALSGILSGLKKCGYQMEDAVLERAAQIPAETYMVCEKKSRIAGGALIRRAINIFIQLLSFVVPLRFISMKDWLRSIELNIVDENEDIRRNAGMAASSFFCLFGSSNDIHDLVIRVKEAYIPKLLHADIECHRQGLALLISTLPVNVLFEVTSGRHLYEDVIATLITIVEKKSNADALWAFGRQACIRAMTEIALKIGVTDFSESGKLVDCILNAMDDYTISRQGDVGRFLRESSMRSLALILPRLGDGDLQMIKTDEAVCKIVQQSCEKIDAVRVCAADVMCDLLCSGLKHIIEKETLVGVYLHGVPYGFVGDPGPYKYDDWRLKSCFPRLAILVTSPHYAFPSINGFIVSAGGLTESTRRNAAEAIFTVIARHRDSPQFMEEFLHNISLTIVRHAGERRVIIPLLCFLDQVFNAQLLTLFETDPDSSPSLAKIVNFVTRIANADGNSRTIRLAVCVLCHILRFNRSSHVWQKAVSVIIRALHCPYPPLRCNAAEQLYECIAAECALEDEMGRREELLDLLANTNWQREGKEDALYEISKSVAQLLNVS